MDRKTLLNAGLALTWEHQYNLKLKQDASSAKFFLAPQAELDKDFSDFFDRYNIRSGEILDIGTGMGEQAVYFAERGFGVTATDVSAVALANAKELAQQKAVYVDFIADNILMTGITKTFDIVADRGCVTLIPVNLRDKYFENVYRLLKPEGWLLIKADKAKKKGADIIDPGRYFTIISQTETSYFNINNIRVHAVFYVVKKADI